jgi:hypothetical protein
MAWSLIISAEKKPDNNDVTFEIGLKSWKEQLNYGKRNEGVN